MEADKRKDIQTAYDIIIDELEVAQEAYHEAAARVTRLAAAADILRDMLDS